MTVHRELHLVRRNGNSTPYRQRWGCRIDLDAGTVHMCVTAPTRPAGDLDEPSARLHSAVLRQIPSMLRTNLRSEVGTVLTESLGEVRQRDYSLVTCGDVVVALADELCPHPVVPWVGTCAMADLDRDLPVVLGPSAVLSLTAGALELSMSATIPSWLAVRQVARSPYPPHDALTERDEPVAWRTEQWMRPMRTTRSSRGQYKVDAALPAPHRLPRAIWVESLVSLDTSGRWWHASLSVERDGRRLWLTQPLSIEMDAADLLHSVVGRVAPPDPAIDRDPVDGESYGWSPTLFTSLSGAELCEQIRS